MSQVELHQIQRILENEESLREACKLLFSEASIDYTSISVTRFHYLLETALTSLEIAAFIKSKSATTKFLASAGAKNDTCLSFEEFFALVKLYLQSFGPEHVSCTNLA
jgi:hypothetical protein